MSKHKVERTAPKTYYIPSSSPKPPKAATLLVDFPWAKSQGGKLGAIDKYDLMSLSRILEFPLKDLAADNCTLWLWTTNACLPDALEVIKKQGFTYRGYFVWCKPRLGLGSYYLRQCTELCLVATRGKVKFNYRSQMNWGIMPTTKHSEKPREFISIIERLCDPPYMELFCRRRPASNNKWWCWGNETEGGADFFIPRFPVPNYSFERPVSISKLKPMDKATVIKRLEKMPEIKLKYSDPVATTTPQTIRKEA